MSRSMFFGVFFVGGVGDSAFSESQFFGGVEGAFLFVSVYGSGETVFLGVVGLERMQIYVFLQDYFVFD